MLPKKYKRRKRVCKVTNSLWSLLMGIALIVFLLVFGVTCGRYMKFMNDEGLPGSETWH